MCGLGGLLDVVDEQGIVLADYAQDDAAVFWCADGVPVFLEVPDGGGGEVV